MLLVRSTMTNRWTLLMVLAACPGPARHEPPPPPPAVHVEYELSGEVHGPPGSQDPSVTRDQPPHIKLKLGHYRNARHGIGVTIDLTEMTESVADIDPAKLRFDGDEKVWRLEGRHGGGDRIDYVRDADRVMLQISRDGRVTVFVPDPDTDRTSDAIEVYRDADADPL